MNSNRFGVKVLQLSGSFSNLKKFIVILLSLTCSVGCVSDSSSEYRFWTHKTDNQITRLDNANIDYKIKEGDGVIDEIWVSEQDFDDVTACCS